MPTEAARPERPVSAGIAPDAESWAAVVQSAWAAGPAGWAHLAAEWTVPAPEPATAAPSEAAPTRCWWDGAPWHGQIADADFRAIVAAYVARHGSYTPDLPARQPGVLRDWLRAHGQASATPPAAA